MQYTLQPGTPATQHTPTRLNLIPWGKDQWVPQHEVATPVAPDALFIQHYDFAAKRWVKITAKSELALLEAHFLALAKQTAVRQNIYRWQSGERIFLGDFEGRRLCVEVR